MLKECFSSSSLLCTVISWFVGIPVGFLANWLFHYCRDKRKKKDQEQEPYFNINCTGDVLTFDGIVKTRSQIDGNYIARFVELLQLPPPQDLQDSNQ